MKYGKMIVSEMRQKWLEAGYEMFADVGPDQFNVEKLAKKVGFNKSGFYHYFFDREFFFEELMVYHSKQGENFAKELSKINEFMPVYPQLICKYKTGTIVQMQLRINFDNPLFKKYYLIVKERNNKYQIPLWAKYLNINDLQLAEELFQIVSDLLVARTESKKLTIDFLIGMFEGIKMTVERIRLKNK